MRKEKSGGRVRLQVEQIYSLRHFIYMMSSIGVTILSPDLSL